jgi:hypothetical protein
MLINNTKLKPVIEDYLSQAYIALAFENTPQLAFDKKLVVIGGDTNDAKDVVKQITFGDITYNYMGNAPFSCCAEVFNVGGRNDTLNKDYIYMGDKFWVFNPNPYNPEYVNVLYEPPPGVIYGGRRHSRNLKKKKLLKKRKTIKKRHYKLKNKKSFKKRRIFRRKTRKHTHT